MSASPTGLPALLLAEDSAAWGDERERTVMLQAYGYAYTLGTVVLWTLAAVAAWFVPAWVTIALFVALLIPSMEWQRYCSARGVDASTLAYGGVAIRRTVVMAVFMVGCALSMIAAVTTALVPGDSVTVSGVIGGLVGGGATVLVMRIRAQRRLRAGDAD